jgi:hypothetical protein
LVLLLLLIAAGKRQSIHAGLAVVLGRNCVSQCCWEQAVGADWNLLLSGAGGQLASIVKTVEVGQVGSNDDHLTQERHGPARKDQTLT